MLFCELGSHVQHQEVLTSAHHHVDAVTGPYRIVDFFRRVHLNAVDLHHNVAWFHTRSDTHAHTHTEQNKGT